MLDQGYRITNVFITFPRVNNDGEFPFPITISATYHWIERIGDQILIRLEHTGMVIGSRELQYLMGEYGIVEGTYKYMVMPFTVNFVLVHTANIIKSGNNSTD